jgi:branched-chain amino acid aminotransferase
VQVSPKRNKKKAKNAHHAKLILAANQAVNTQHNNTTVNSDGSLTCHSSAKTNQAMASASGPSEPKKGIDFESLPWNLNCPEEHSYIHITTSTGEWTDEHYHPTTDDGLVLSSLKKYSTNPLSLYPSTTSLNYGTTIWEGLKCFRKMDGTATVFRPEMNWKRFCRGAEAMCLPAPSRELFLRGVQAVVQANSELIPPYGDGMKLYIRPMLLGTGQQLGLYPSCEMSLLFYVSPTGNYFSAKTCGLNLHLETDKSRAAIGGSGSVKCSGNYAVALKPLMDAKKQGFDDNLFLELETYRNGNLKDAVVQELSAANVFVVLKTGEIVTPALERNTILPGVTRDSIVVLIREFKDELQQCMVQSTGNSNVVVTVKERDVTVGEFENATEAFVTGTAAEVVPIARLATYSGTDENNAQEFCVEFTHGKSLPGGPVTSKLLDILREIMTGKRTCKTCEGWLRDPFSSPVEFCS